MATKAATIDEYIAGFPAPTQKLLQQVRAIIKKAAPKAVETISYAIPAFKMNDSYLVYFAGFKNHISVYPILWADKELAKELAPYKKGKGTAQFALDQKLPVALVTKIVKSLIKANIDRALKKSTIKKTAK